MNNTLTMRILSQKLFSTVLAVAFIGLAITFAGCDNLTDFKEINDNPNDPTDVPSTQQLAAATTQFTYEVVANEPVRTPTLWTQQLAANVQGGGNIDVYQYREVDGNNLWEAFLYTGSIRNGRNIADAGLEEENFQNAGIGMVIEAYSWMILTDLFGDVPFTEAFLPDENLSPSYDEQEVVYQYIIDRLGEARENLAKTNLGTTDNSTADLLFGGDVDKWTSLAWALEARAHIHLTESDITAGGVSGRDGHAQAALDAAQNAFPNGNADNAEFTFPGGANAENPWFQYTIQDVWIVSQQVSANYIDLLKTNEDPRLPVQARQTGAVDADGPVGSFVPTAFDPTEDFAAADSTYRGHENGADQSQNIDVVSSIGSFYSDDDASVFWFNYAEVKFIEAEAQYILNGDAVNGDVEAAYQEGIEASLEQLGVISFVNQTFIDDFVQDRVDALNNATDPLEEIITEKYIANFINIEPYNDLRRTDYPDLQPVADGVIDNIPLRLPYPVSEYQTNGENVPGDVPRGPQGGTVPVDWDPGL